MSYALFSFWTPLLYVASSQPIPFNKFNLKKGKIPKFHADGLFQKKIIECIAVKKLKTNNS